MLWIDLEKAVSCTGERFDRSAGDNFTLLLFQLILKADDSNRVKMRMMWPVEVNMVEIYKHNHPYKKGTTCDIDFEEIERLAKNDE